MDERIESTMLMKTQGWTLRENRPSSSNNDSDQLDNKTKLIKVQYTYIYGVAFHVDGKHVASGNDKGQIQRWRVEDGEEVGTPMDAGSGGVLSIAMSRDGKWIVSGTEKGAVTVWNAQSLKKLTEFGEDTGRCAVRAVDISPDGTRIASGSDGWALRLWSLSTHPPVGQRLLASVNHGSFVIAAKFSPDGRVIATANVDSVRVYSSQNGPGRLLMEVPIRVNSLFNNSLAWTSDSKQLFILSLDGNIHCLDASTGITLSKWPIHCSKDAQCIVLARSGTLIAASAGRSVSFWNTTTHEQVGSVIEFTHYIKTMAISANADLAVSGDNKITLRILCDIIPSSYFDVVSAVALSV